MKETRNWLFTIAILLLIPGFSVHYGIRAQPDTKRAQGAALGTAGANGQAVEAARQRREQAYLKLLEGQRHIWGLSTARTQAAIVSGSLLAKESLQQAIQLEPNLAEGYTALAELTYRSPPSDPDEAIRLAGKAIKINPDNFGGHQILARLYTIKSQINQGIPDPEFSALAIREWEEVGRLDPRNAEAFAFLSEFYDKTRRPQQKIEALKKWLSSASPLDSRFFRVILQEDLSPETALTKLGAALLYEGSTKEAVEILSRAVADDPNSDEAIELLGRAVETADDKTAAIASESLHQAIFANPGNTALPILLAQISARSGDLTGASGLLETKIADLLEKDKISASIMQMSVGDLYLEADRFNQAATSYEKALVIRGIKSDGPITDDDRDFAAMVYEKIIRTLKVADRPKDAKKAIEEARVVFGSGDLFADKHLVNFYLEQGQRDEALRVVRTLRSRDSGNYELLRLEATTLTAADRVAEGVALLRELIGKKQSASGTGPVFAEYDDFMNYLYISSLYSQAKRGKEAVEAANQAIQAARSSDRKKIGRMTLATAQQMSGDFAGAESTLRDILNQTPGYPMALNNLGYFLLERNVKLQEALELIAKAVEIDPTNPSFLDSLGWAYFKLGKFEEAEKYLKSAIRYSPGSSTILEHLGDVYQQQGNDALARSNWQKALAGAAEKTDIERLKTKLSAGPGKQ